MTGKPRDQHLPEDSPDLPAGGNIGGHDAVGGTGEGTRSYGDPVQVAEDGIQHAISKLHDVVIVDTAGRLAVDAALMQQAADIRATIEPTMPSSTK